MPPGALKGNRWYDEYPPIVRAAELMESLPEQYRRYVAASVVAYTQENNLLGSPEELKNVGHQKVLGLFQSKLRRRWYDKDPILHKAVNNILLMDEENRRNVSYRLVVSLEALESYREQCDKQQLLPSFEDMEQIVADIFARNLEELIAITTGRKPEPQKEKTTNKTITSDDSSGMRVSQFFNMD